MKRWQSKFNYYANDNKSIIIFTVVMNTIAVICTIINVTTR